MWMNGFRARDFVAPRNDIPEMASSESDVRHTALISKVEQCADALGGGGMAAKQARRIMHECGRAAWCRAGVMALQLVECGDERSRVAGQFERRCICIQFANARQSKSEELAESWCCAQQHRQWPA